MLIHYQLGCFDLCAIQPKRHDIDIWKFLRAPFLFRKLNFSYILPQDFSPKFLDYTSFFNLTTILILFHKICDTLIVGNILDIYFLNVSNILSI